MRIWSLHPKYLDTKGLVALWRETLLAKHVLEGKTKGYTLHPQLTRFKKCENPVNQINQYLSAVYEEALKRNFNFDKDKIGPIIAFGKIPLNQGQLDYETKHLLEKLKRRDVQKYKEVNSLQQIESHPLFVIQEGSIEDWEIIT